MQLHKCLLLSRSDKSLVLRRTVSLIDDLFLSTKDQGALEYMNLSVSCKNFKAFVKVKAL